MRHQKANRKFGRKAKGRQALLKALTTSLLTKETIETSEAKAKELRPYVEKLVTRAKNDSVASRRLIASKIGNGPALEKLFTDIAPKYKTRPGGYTRIVKLPRRLSDGSFRAMIQFV